MTPCEIKEKTAIALGISLKHILKMTYNIKELDVMKFDYIIMNPPYNQAAKAGRGGGSGSAIWQKFVLHSKNLLNDDGTLIVIHPDGWRDHPTDPGKNGIAREKHQVFKMLTDGGLVELHMMEFSAFNGIGTSTDWYVYKNGRNGKTKVFYSDGSENNLNFIGYQKQILKLNTSSIGFIIINKVITDVNYNSGIILDSVFQGKIKTLNGPIGNYKITHGSRWTKDKWEYSKLPHIHQFNDKVVICAMRDVQAKYFSKQQEIGCGAHTHYWLVNTKEEGESIAALCNSKLFAYIKNILIHKSNAWTPYWIWKQLKVDGITGLLTDEDFYKHYQLTEEEIKCIKQ